MRLVSGLLLGSALLAGWASFAGCKSDKVVLLKATIPAQDLKPAQDAAQLVPVPGRFVGFDRNDYPGDNRLAELRKSFSFAGYWLTPPPGETANTWVGKRGVLRDAGFGFLLLANGRAREADPEGSAARPMRWARRTLPSRLRQRSGKAFPKARPFSSIRKKAAA